VAVHVKRKVFGSHTDNRTYIYHYTSAKTAKELILSNRTLRFGEYSKTNDPQETMSWQFHMGTNLGEDSPLNDLDHRDMDELSVKFDKYIKENTYVLCFCCDGNLTGDTVKDIHSRGYCKPKMWAQYGDEHRGVCLVFNQSLIKNYIGEQFMPADFLAEGSVRYFNQNVVGNMYSSPFGIYYDRMDELGFESYAAEHLKIWMGDLFFTKATDWSNEAEYRAVMFKPGATNLLLNYGDALEGIVFGNYCSKKDIEDICSIEHSAVMEQLTWKNWAPWYSHRKDLDKNQ